MCTDPVLLCLDEPAAGLNPRESAELNELLLYPRRDGIAILLIEHDMSVVMNVSDHIVVLSYGARSPKARRRRSQRPAGDQGLPGRGRRGRGRKVRPMIGGRSRMMLKMEGVHAHYGHIQALRGVDVEVQVGEIVTLIGANGAGKSTLMMTIFGNPKRSAGRIVFDGEDITRVPTHEIARRGIAQCPRAGASSRA
jgi:ABC-type branched-subunit amino acid transport system ATPase component